MYIYISIYTRANCKIKMLVFFDETTRASHLLPDVIYRRSIRVDTSTTRYTGIPIYRSFIGWRRIAVKKWLARYQRLTHPLIPRQTIGRAIVAGRRAADVRGQNRISSVRSSGVPIRGSIYFNGIRFSFGQYTALWLKVSSQVLFLWKGMYHLLSVFRG